MIKLLSISGSPVDGASTDIILYRLIDAIKKYIGDRYPVEHKFIKLNKISFIPCQACGKSPEPKYCFYDELDVNYIDLEECDCLLFGSPVYFDTVSAQAKAFIDRCNCFRPPDFDSNNPNHSFIKRLTKKRPGVIVLVGSEDCYLEGARRVIAGFFKWVEVVNESLVTFQSKDINQKGTVLSDEVTLNEINQTAERLALAIIKNNEKD